jgi:hypothetical protein
MFHFKDICQNWALILGCPTNSFINDGKQSDWLQAKRPITKLQTSGTNKHNTFAMEKLLQKVMTSALTRPKQLAQVTQR